MTEKSKQKSEWIMSYLKDKDYTSPSVIGNAYGIYLLGTKYNKYHSSWASPICLRLVKANKLERNDKGHYRLVGKPNN